MKPLRNNRCAVLAAGLALAAWVALPTSLWAAPASAAPTSDAIAKAEAAYRADRAACLSGASQQDQATCLKEAGAILAERRRGSANTGTPQATLRANAVNRCAVQPPAERHDCERLAMGDGSQQGTVASGGVIKELVTVIPAAESASNPR